MPSDFRFIRRLDTAAAERLRFTFDDAELHARPGDSVAAALLAAGVYRFRDTPVSGVARGPFCLMGACFECLLEIDGVPNRQGCMTEVRDGMRVRPMRGARDSITDDSITGDSITDDSITGDSITDDSITDDSITDDSGADASGHDGVGAS